MGTYYSASEAMMLPTPPVPVPLAIHGPPTEPPHVADPLVFDHIIGLLP